MVLIPTPITIYTEKRLATQESFEVENSQSSVWRVVLWHFSKTNKKLWTLWDLWKEKLGPHPHLEAFHVGASVNCLVLPPEQSVEREFWEVWQPGEQRGSCLFLCWWILKEQPFLVGLKKKTRRAQLELLLFHLVRTYGLPVGQVDALKVRWALDHLKMTCPRRRTVDSGRWGLWSRAMNWEKVIGGRLESSLGMWTMLYGVSWRTYISLVAQW